MELSTREAVEERLLDALSVLELPRERASAWGLLAVGLDLADNLVVAIALLSLVRATREAWVAPISEKAAGLTTRLTTVDEMASPAVEVELAATA